MTFFVPSDSQAVGIGIAVKNSFNVALARPCQASRPCHTCTGHALHVTLVCARSSGSNLLSSTYPLRISASRSVLNFITPLYCTALSWCCDPLPHGYALRLHQFLLYSGPATGTGPKTCLLLCVWMQASIYSWWCCSSRGKKRPSLGRKAEQNSL
jgi:hypothetical protein